MSRPVLETKIVGLAPDPRGLMHPPEIVYQTSEPPRAPPPTYERANSFNFGRVFFLIFLVSVLLRIAGN